MIHEQVRTSYIPVGRYEALLGFNMSLIYAQGSMRTALSSLIEGYKCNRLFSVIGFNSSNICALFNGAPMYSESSIFPCLGYWIGAFVWILGFLLFYCTLVLFHVLYNFSVCGFCFRVGYLYLLAFLHILIASQSVMKVVFSIMSHTNTSWSDVVFNSVWYVL